MARSKVSLEGVTMLQPDVHPTLVPEPVPPPTTPTIKVVQDSPEENLFNVSYEATANHYWVFSTDNPWLTDKAPESNFLTLSLLKRYRNKEFETVAIDIQHDLAGKSLFKELVSVTSHVSSRCLKAGMFPDDSKSILLDRASKTQCVELVSDVNNERPYFRRCLLNPEDCEYGLSVSLWVNFLTSEAASTDQTLISTSPSSGAGFLMKIKNDMLIAQVIGNITTWTCSVPYSISTNTWNNYAFRWYSTNGNIDIFLNKKLILSCEGPKIQTINGVIKAPVQRIWLGCTAESGAAIESTSIVKAYIIHPVLWYWPLDLNVLFLGDKADRLEVPTTVLPTTETPIALEVDYTKIVEEYQPKNWSSLPMNPYYATADGFYELITSPTQNFGQDVELVKPNCRGRGSYRLKTDNAYYKLDSIDPAFSLSSITSGFSIGAWVNIPSSLLANTASQSLFEIADVIRIVLFGDFLHVFVFDGKKWGTTRIVEAVVRDEVFNLGFSISGNSSNKALGFINGANVQTMAFAAQSPTNDLTHSPISRGDLILGSKVHGRSATGAEIGDLVYWMRYASEHEGHRFLGYTRSQVRLLAESDIHWSTDAFMLYDAPCRIAFERKRHGITDLNATVPGFKLASLYKPSGMQPFRYILDQEEKSIAPTLSMRKVDYFMLGRRWKSQPNQDDLLWLNHCLYDPSATSCGSHGVTISVWLSLQSVSKSRIRYIFNSGDAGDSEVSAVMDGHGWAIFTRGSLIGASVSMRTEDWSLILDSKTYSLDTWINLGVTWSTSDGLRLFINGMDLHAHTVYPKTRYKQYQDPAYLLIGRLDTDDSSNWLTPAEAELASAGLSSSGIPVFWEMAHFAFSEITYINRQLTPREYAQFFDFLGNEMIEKNSKRLWFGLNILDPRIPDLLLASRLGGTLVSQLGAHAIYNASTFEVEYKEDWRAVILGQFTVLRLGPLDPSECPGTLKQCANGFTVGGWYALITVSDGMSHTNFTQPVILLIGNGGDFGIALYEGGHELVGWVNNVTCHGSSTTLTQTTRHNQWFHVALSWLSDEVYLFLNGNLLSTCKNSSAYRSNGQRVYADTNSNEFFMLIIPPRSGRDYRLAVGIVNIWETIIDSEMGISDFMGLTLTEGTNFAMASHYWPMNGLLTYLAPSKLLTSNVVLAKDRRNVDGDAMCTTNSKLSHIVLTGDARPGGKNTNLFYSCLYTISQCTKIIFTLDFLLNGDSGYANQDYVLLTSPSDSANVGITITLNPIEQLLKVEHRSNVKNCSSWANLKDIKYVGGNWINLQAFIADGSVTLRLNDMDVQNLNPNSCTAGQFSPLDYTSSPFPKIVIGEELGVCVSNVAIIESSKQSDLVPPALVEVCYPEADVIFPLEGSIPNRFGKPNKATDLSIFTERKISKKLTGCLNNFMMSCSEISLSFWLLIKRIDFPIVDRNNYLVMSTGPATYQGISVAIEYPTTPNSFNLVVKLVTSDSIYLIFSANYWRTDEWVNVGVVATTGENSMGISMELYRNGLPLMTTSSPLIKDASIFYPKNPNSGVYFGASIATISKMNAVRIASGGVSMFAFWLQRVASCGTPRSSYMHLLGECSVNETLPETVPCQSASNCQLSTNGVCLDNSVDNIYSMARGVSLISSPSAILSLLHIVEEVLVNKSIRPGSEDEKKLLWSGVVLLNRLSVVEQSSAFEIEILQNVAEATFDFLLQFLEFLFEPNHKDVWRKLQNTYLSNPPEIVEAMAAMLRALRLENSSALVIARGSNFVASFSSFQNVPNFNGIQPMQVIESPTHSRVSDVKTYTVSILGADTSGETMDVLSLPRLYFWKDSENATKVKSGSINSPVLTSSVRSLTSVESTLYDYTINLIVKNEFKEGAAARRTDCLHWKAKKVEETGEGLMEYEVKCVYWDEENGNGWNSEQCSVMKSNLTYTVCRCNGTGSFAVVMSYPDEDDSFWKMAGAVSLKWYKLIKLILNVATNSISVAALAVLAIYLSWKNTLPELRDHTKVKLNLTMAFIAYHLCFMIFPLLEEIEVLCKTVGALEHFFTCAALGWQCLNNCYIFNALINGKLKSSWKMSIFIAWFVNAAIVAVVTCSTSASDYGTGLMCSPTGLSSYIAMVESGLFLLISLAACTIMLCNIDTPAYLNPRVIEALQNEMYGSVAMTAYSLVVFVLGVVMIHNNLPNVVFIFWMLNSVHGCLIAVIMGLLDKSNVVRKRKSSESVETSQILGSSVNYGQGKEETNEFGEFGDFEDADGGMIGDEMDSTLSPYNVKEETKE
nr:cadherin EGF LAG seven pass G type receptor 1 [Hymenolepis microstoma]